MARDVSSSISSSWIWFFRRVKSSLAVASAAVFAEEDATESASWARTAASSFSKASIRGPSSGVVVFSGADLDGNGGGGGGCKSGKGGGA